MQTAPGALHRLLRRQLSRGFSFFQDGKADEALACLARAQETLNQIGPGLEQEPVLAEECLELLENLTRLFENEKNRLARGLFEAETERKIQDFLASKEPPGADSAAPFRRKMDDKNRATPES